MSGGGGKIRSTLYLQVLVAIAVGIGLGIARPKAATAMKPLADGFLQLIKTLIAPIIFATVSAGIAGMGDLKKVGRVGAKALLYFEAMTTVALALGVLVMHLVHPGRGLHAAIEAHGEDAEALGRVLAQKHAQGAVAHLLGVIPDGFVTAFTSGEILQVLLVAVLSGVAIARLGADRKTPILKGLEAITHVLFGIVTIVMRAAPLGAFGAMSFVVGRYGVHSLSGLVRLLVTYYATAAFFVVGILGLVLRLFVRAEGVSIVRVLRYLKDELLIVLGTSSSESALPPLMDKLERLGCAPEVVRLVVPTGYSFNLDGTCIYLTMASLFVAEALDVPLTFVEELTLLGVLLLTSKGAAGVSGSGFITLAGTLESTGTVPVAGLSLIFGIDKFMSEVRALTNICGNAVATIVVAKWEGAFDAERARAALDGLVAAPPPLVGSER